MHPTEGRTLWSTFFCHKNIFWGKTVTSVISLLDKCWSDCKIFSCRRVTKTKSSQKQRLPSSSSNSSPATSGINISPDSPSKSSDEWCFGERDFVKRTAIFSESLSAFIMRSRRTATINQPISWARLILQKEANAYLSREYSNFVSKRVVYTVLQKSNVTTTQKQSANPPPR